MVSTLFRKKKTEERENGEYKFRREKKTRLMKKKCGEYTFTKEKKE